MSEPMPDSQLAEIKARDGDRGSQQNRARQIGDAMRFLRHLFRRLCAEIRHRRRMARLRRFEEENDCNGELCESCAQPFDIQADGVGFDTEDACWFCPACAEALRLEPLPPVPDEFKARADA